MVARRLAAARQQVIAVLVGVAVRIAGPAAAHNWAVLQAMAAAGSLQLFIAPSAELLVSLRARLSPASLLVDALLGSGAAGPLREPVVSAVQLMNAIRTHAAAAGRPCRVLAVDTPTLIGLTGGEQSDPVVAADVTVTFHRPRTASARSEAGAWPPLPGGTSGSPSSRGGNSARRASSARRITRSVAEPSGRLRRERQASPNSDLCSRGSRASPRRRTAGSNAAARPRSRSDPRPAPERRSPPAPMTGRP